jgi:hypothetical protein
MVRLTSGADKQWTGVMIDSSGLILTTSSDLGASPLANFRTVDGANGKAWVIGRDDTFGLALLEVISPGQQYSAIEVHLGDFPTRNEEIALLHFSGSQVDPSASDTRVTGSRQDSSTGVSYVQYQGISISGEQGGAVVDADGLLRGLRMTSSQMIAIGVGRVGEIWAMDASSLGGALIPRLKGRISVVSSTDGQCDGLGAPPPIPAIYSGTATLGGVPIAVNERLYAEVTKTATGEHLWFSDMVVATGRYILTIGICDPSFSNSPVEFWLNARTSTQRSSYVPGNSSTPALAFP